MASNALLIMTQSSQPSGRARAVPVKTAKTGAIWAVSCRKDRPVFRICPLRKAVPPMRDASLTAEAEASALRLLTQSNEDHGDSWSGGLNLRGSGHEVITQTRNGEGREGGEGD